MEGPQTSRASFKVSRIWHSRTIVLTNFAILFAFLYIGIAQVWICVLRRHHNKFHVVFLFQFHTRERDNLISQYIQYHKSWYSLTERLYSNNMQFNTYATRNCLSTNKNCTSSHIEIFAMIKILFIQWPRDHSLLRFTKCDFFGMTKAKRMKGQPAQSKMKRVCVVYATK